MVTIKPASEVVSTLKRNPTKLLGLEQGGI